MQTQIKCPDCRQSVSLSGLKQHVIMCRSYVAKLLPSTTRLADHLTKDYLQFLVAELDLAKERIIQKIDEEHHDRQHRENVVFGTYETVKVEQDNNQQAMLNSRQMNGSKRSEKQQRKMMTIQQTLGKPEEQQKQVEVNIKKQVKIEDKKLQKTHSRNYESEVVVCQNCEKVMSVDDVTSFTYKESCFHLLCINCIKSYLEDQYVAKKGQLKCLVKQCKDKFIPEQVREIVGAAQFDKLQAQILRSQISFIKCFKCSHQYQFTQGKAADAPKNDLDGKKLSKVLAQHYAKNRFVCPNPACKIQQCKLCHAAPYHIGKSCSQNQQYKNSKKCRYCKAILKKGYTSNKGIKAFDDICPKKQCQKLAKNACSKIHKCGHPCLGVIKQVKCLPCLNQACCKKQKEVKHQQDEDSYCSICYVEDLKAGPCVMSKCGHIFHYSCLQKRLQIRWLTPRILFGFCHCPLCKEWIQLPDECTLSQTINKNKQLYENLRQKAYNRLKYEKLENDAKITDSKSNFYKKPIDYAMAIYAYFQCYKCKKPYFGGRKSCAEMMNEESNTSAHTDFDATKLVCPQCCPVQTKNCSLHGKEFLAFKCKFCCNIGLWFCWGSTHFCDDCHKRQQKGEYISKIPKQKLPKCEGKEKCPSGGDHGQNGAQFSLGCLLCRSKKNQPKDF